MSTAHQATRAYALTAARRDPREQEADVFRRINAALRHCRAGGDAGRIRALADNGRLWTTVIDLVRDPDNALPERLRADLASVGLAVQREMRAPSPDFDFLLSINESVAVGLAGRGP